MNFREYFQWFRSLHRTQKWFIVLIAIRPLIDNFYYLKTTSPFLSPLYIAGVLTPVLCLWSIGTLRKKYYSPIDFILGLWLIIILISSFFGFLNNPKNLKFYEFFFQTIISIVIFYFSRRLITSPRNLDGVLQTTLYAASIAACFFLYEIYYQPFKAIESRGIMRLEGAYADVMNYGIYITQSILICCYFALQKNISLSKTSKIVRLIIVMVLAAVALPNIVHVSTIAVTFTIFILFLLFFSRQSLFTGVSFIVLIFVIIINLNHEAIDEKFSPLYRPDLEVLSGDRDKEKAFHGRMSRWERMWAEFSDQPLIAQFFGIPLTLSNPFKYLLSGPHNDYLRIIFLSGYIGFILYMIFLLNIFLRLKTLPYAHKFLVLGALATMILYSVSTTPTLYAPLIYVIYPVYAFAVLPPGATRNYK